MQYFAYVKRHGATSPVNGECKMKSLNAKLVLSALGIVATLTSPAFAKKPQRHVTHSNRSAIYNMVPGYTTQTQSDYSNAPAATGGGSLGYNQNLYNW